MKIHHNSKTDRIGIQAVGEQFERAGYIFREQPISDYGIDAQIEVVEGEIVTGELIALQIKTGTSWFQESTPQGYVFRGDNEPEDDKDLSAMELYIKAKEGVSKYDQTNYGIIFTGKRTEDGEIVLETDYSYPLP